MRRCSSLVISLVALVLAGCAGYKLGPTNGTAAGEKSIQIVPFENRTVEPHLTDAVTTEVRKRIQHDGTFKLDTHGNGDVILTGVITQYDRSELSVQPGDTFTVRDYRVGIAAEITARSRTTGKVILDKKVVRAYSMLRTGSDLVSDERQNLPLLAENLAKEIVSVLADGGW